MTTIAKIAAGLALAVRFQAEVDAADERVFVLRKNAAGMALERVPLTGDRPLAFDGGPDGDVIDVIFPVGPGGSGNLADCCPGRRLTARIADGKVLVAEQIPGGRGFDRPARSLADLTAFDTRVSVVGADGHGKAFIIRGYDQVAGDDAGPIVDLFAGKVPLSPGKFLITTDTWPVVAGPPVAGVIPLEFNRYLFARGRAGAAAEGDFVVDLGASSTVMAKPFLPAGAEIVPATTVQYSAGGRELLKYEPEGATGKVQTVLGHCDLEQLTLGGLSFGTTSVDVMAELPKIGGREIAGILGLDVLRRADRLSFEFADHRATLRLGPASASTARDVGHPFALVNSHLLLRTGSTDPSIFWIVDTGSPVTILDRPAADALRLPLETGGPSAGGLDGAKLAFAKTVLPSLRLSGHGLTQLPISVAALPIFDRLHVRGQNVGLLGNDILSSRGKLEIDFVSRTLVLSQR